MAEGVLSHKRATTELVCRLRSMRTLAGMNFAVVKLGLVLPEVGPYYSLTLSNVIKLIRG